MIFLIESRREFMLFNSLYSCFSIVILSRRSIVLLLATLNDTLKVTTIGVTSG